MKKFIFFVIVMTLLSQGLVMASNSVSNDFVRYYPERSMESRSIITTVPEGKISMFMRSGTCFYFSSFGIGLTDYDNVPGEMVECDNGDVYVRDIFSQLTFDSYLMGYREGDDIVFDLPQIIGELTYGETTIQLEATLMQFYPGENDEEGFYYEVNSPEAIELGLPEIENKLRITIEEGGIYRLQPGNDGDIILGVVNSDDRSWTGEGEVSSIWVPFHEDVVTPPENLTTKEMVVVHDDTGHFVNVGIDNDDVYVQGIFEAAPDAWIKGYRDGNKIIFKSGQFLGFDFFFNKKSYFVAAHIERVYDDYWNEWYDAPIYEDEIVFNYDEENKIMTTPEINAIVYNGEADEMDYFEYYVSPSIYSQPDDISLTPANPFNLEYSDNFYDFGYNYIKVSLPLINKDGYLLKKTNLYYRIYIDNDIFVFSSEDYVTLTEDMTLIPYDFKMGYDIYINGIIHQIYFYIEGIEEVGVQLCYMEEGEIKGESDVISVSTSHISQPMDNKPTAVKYSYFNVNGQEVDSHFKGVVIKVEEYEDGTRKSFKVVKM